MGQATMKLRIRVVRIKTTAELLDEYYVQRGLHTTDTAEPEPRIRHEYGHKKAGKAYGGEG